MFLLNVTCRPLLVRLAKSAAWAAKTTVDAIQSELTLRANMVVSLYRDLYFHVGPTAVIAEVPGYFPRAVVYHYLKMYAPGSLKLAVVAALPPSSLVLAGLNLTSPGPRYFTQSIVIPTDFPFLIGRPSSVADNASRSASDFSIVFSMVSTLTTGGVLEYGLSIFAPRVVYLRSMIHAGFSVPGNLHALPVHRERPH